MTGCDNTPEERARLKPSPRWDTHQAKLHDFNNRVTELVLAVQLQESRLIGFYSEELSRVYAEAIGGN